MVDKINYGDSGKIAREKINAMLEETEAHIPSIGENGNRYLGETDTGIPATGPQGNPGPQGQPGKPGKDGSTPVKGVDYFTPEDIESLDIPEKTSELQNDSGFITKAVSDLTYYYTKSETYTKSEVDSNLTNYFNTSTQNSDDITEGNTNLFLTISERTLLSNQSGINTGDQSASDFDIKDLADKTGKRSTWDGKQDALVSGTNIKTINGTSVLGTGDIVTPDTTYVASDFDIKDLTDSTSLRTTWSGKQDALTLPATPTQGNLVVWGANNKTFVDGGTVPTGVPSGGNNGDVLTNVSGTPTWQAPSGGDVMVSSQSGNILTSGMKIWAGTEADYGNLGTYDSNTLYLVIE